MTAYILVLSVKKIFRNRGIKSFGIDGFKSCGRQQRKESHVGGNLLDCNQ